VGLANGFIEPLESTGLMLTHEAIVKIIAMLSMHQLLYSPQSHVEC
jgi:hypothetical protein